MASRITIKQVPKDVKEHIETVLSALVDEHGFDYVRVTYNHHIEKAKELASLKKQQKVLTEKIAKLEGNGSKD